jgi:hypothetical protein
MDEKEVGMVHELGGNVEQFAGEAVREQVMAGSETIDTSTDAAQVAMWTRGAIERLDALVDEPTRIRIMQACGTKCASVNTSFAEAATARRKKCKSLDEFLEAEIESPITGTRLEREGDVLYQYYTPQLFTPPMRCYCALLYGLPADETVSPTYCHCSKAFVRRFWETVLGRPVEVEVVYSAMTGHDECKFAIRM